MDGSISVFSADYRDGTVQFERKRYPAGTFCVDLLNDYPKLCPNDGTPFNCKAIRKVSAELHAGYLIEKDIIDAREEVLHILDLLKRLSPFSILDPEWEKLTVNDLFTKETAGIVSEYFRQQSLAGKTDFTFVQTDIYPPGYDCEFCRHVESQIEEMFEVLDFYVQLESDIWANHEYMEFFVEELMGVKRFDEEHILPIANEIFEPYPQEVRIKYISKKKNRRSKYATILKRMYFKRYESFIITDLYEGLHHGHYPKRCEICGRYFLMTTAHKTRYCDGYANELYRGKKITCRNLAALRKKKEHPEDNPIIIRYTKRCNVIRVEKGRGTITESFAAAAKALAKEHKQIALSDPVYAEGQYIRDMEHDRLYEDTNRRLKQEAGS